MSTVILVNKLIVENLKCDFVALSKNDLLYKSYNKKDYFLYRCGSKIQGYGINPNNSDYGQVVIIAQ